MKFIVFVILLICNVIVYSDSLKVGILEFAPPFSSKVDTKNHYSGFVIDLMNTICSRLKYECDYVAIPINGEFYGLDKGIFDVSFSPSPINTYLSDKYIFSLPYLASDGQFMTLSTGSINSIEDIKNKKIGVFKFNFHNSEVLSNYLSSNKVVVFNDPVELVNQLTLKKIDVVLINYYSAKFVIDITGAELKLVGDKISIGNGYGVVALKNNSGLINNINHILLDLEKNGTYLKIYNQYFGSHGMNHMKIHHKN